MNDIGLDGCPKADAMLRRVDPYGLTQREGGLAGAPEDATTSFQTKQVLTIVAAALAAGAAVAVAVGAISAHLPRENPIRGPNKNGPPEGDEVAHRDGANGYAFVTKEADCTYYVWKEWLDKTSWVFHSKRKAEALKAMRKAAGGLARL